MSDFRPTGERWHLKDQYQLNRFVEWVKHRWLENNPPTLQVMGESRTGEQNKMIYALYGEISRHLGDTSVLEVRRQCKLYYGVPILRAASPEFCDSYDRLIKKRFTTPEKLELMDHMDITSDFTKEQAGHYIDHIIEAYREKGIVLKNPKEEMSKP